MRILLAVALLSFLTTAAFADQAEDEKALTALATALKAEDAIVSTPVSRANAANEFSAEVELVDAKDDEALKALVGKEVTATSSFWAGDAKPGPETLVTLAGTDVHVTMLAGYQEPKIRSYLTAIVSPSKRAAVAALLGTVGGYFVRLEIYDISAEIIGDELIVFKPLFAEHALVIRLHYVHA